MDVVHGTSHFSLSSASEFNVFHGKSGHGTRSQGQQAQAEAQQGCPGRGSVAAIC